MELQENRHITDKSLINFYYTDITACTAYKVTSTGWINYPGTLV